MDKPTTLLSGQQTARLREVAVAHSGKLGDFAAFLGMSGSNFSQYLRGERGIKGSKLYLRLIENGFNPDWILTGEGSRYAENEAGRKLKEQHNAALRFASKNVSAVQEIAQQTETTEIEEEDDEKILQYIYKRYELLRSWLTESGTITEWYLKCKEAVPGMTLTDVLALEGMAEGSSKRPPKEFFAFVHRSGIDVSWLEGFIDGDPFREGVEGEALKERLIERFLSHNPDESSALVRDSVRQLSRQGVLQDYEPRSQ